VIDQGDGGGVVRNLVVDLPLAALLTGSVSGTIVEPSAAAAVTVS
jgi:hypothetical protein